MIKSACHLFVSDLNHAVNIKLNESWTERLNFLTGHFLEQSVTGELLVSWLIIGLYADGVTRGPQPLATGTPRGSRGRSPPE